MGKASEHRSSVTVTGDGGSMPVDVREQLMKRAEEMRKKIGAPSGDKIRLLKSKAFKLPNGTESSDPLRVVVLDFVSYNAWFDRPFGENTPPACFALGPDPLLLAPSDKSPDKQADSCGVCPFNEFGSRGKGKECGNHRLLAVVEPTGDPESPIYLLQTGPTTVKHWDAYVTQVLNRFPLGIVSVSTEIYFDPSSDYVSLRFGTPLPNEFVGVHSARIEAATARLMTDPDVSNYEKPKPVARGGKKK